MNPAATTALDRARAAIELDRWDTAAAEARRAIAADPVDASAHGVLAQALAGQDQLAAALAAAEQAISLRPDSEWLHRLRGSVLLDQGRPKDALAAFDEALRLDADIAQTYGLRARALDKMGHSAKAREAVKRGLELAPRSGWMHRTHGDVALHADDPHGAERGYREALRCEPHDAISLNNLGVALQKQERHDEAALAFKAAVLADPTLTVAKSNTHSAVKNLTGPIAVGAGATGLGALKFCAMGSAARGVSSASGGDAGTILAVIVVIVVVVLLVASISRAHRKARAEDRVKALDPQLWDLYQKLDKDRRAGRI